ncbi:MAG TPA: hypothetical protein VKR29_00435 [Candidatus Binataceae bacterium]|nr:hypothetical protein [Candidatus Binataceae bacterium]
MNRKISLASFLTALMVGGLVYVGTASAQNNWQENHPARTEVNQRLLNQDRRINQGERHGQLNGAEAQQLHAEDQSIRNQERQDAAEHHGHITRAEKRQLNREENAESRQIYQERHDH